MINYILKRLLGMIPVLLGVTILSFSIVHLAPGKFSTLDQAMNPRVSPEYQQRLTKAFNLDKPLAIQYLLWLKKSVMFDFGRSFLDNRPIAHKIIERIPVTVGINILSLFVVFLFAIPIGIKAALRAGRAFDNIVTYLSFFLLAAPTFWLALLLMQFFCIRLGWLPISGIHSLDFEYFAPWHKFLDVAWHLVLPIFVSSLGGLVVISRYMRSSILEALSQPYICTARAKGLPENKVVYKHALRNALLPIVTLVGLSIPGLLGSSVIFESLFALPGLGQLFFQAVMMRDIPLIMAEVVLGAILTILGNLIADISYAYVDPRIRYK
ncbi:MAG: ABC transporter permease [Candidatus Omnitrophica bacterium]|jgi:peptide/nickel transport system permease protein|nr:ABC transporter permease [Candidatus Omnitrophota bacterium]